MPLPPAVSLSGYGVELAIKSTEYKAIDDSNVNSGGGEEEQAPQNLHGFNFRALRLNKFLKNQKCSTMSSGRNTSICATSSNSFNSTWPSWTSWPR
jgi:hypothetical protein